MTDSSDCGDVLKRHAPKSAFSGKQFIAIFSYHKTLISATASNSNNRITHAIIIVSHFLAHINFSVHWP